MGNSNGGFEWSRTVLCKKLLLLPGRNATIGPVFIMIAKLLCSHLVISSDIKSSSWFHLLTSQLEAEALGVLHTGFITRF